MIAYTGLAGSGKTYHMAEVCQKVLASGSECFGTTPFQGARLLDNHRQLLRIENAHIFFDEWHQDHDAKAWYNLDPVLRHIVSQHRKYKLTIHWSSQHFLFMDSFIRRETDFVWDHEAINRDPMTGRSKITFPRLGIYGLHRAIQYPALEVELKHRRPVVLSKRIFTIRKKIFDTYDSYKKIMLNASQVTDEEIAAITDPYKAEVIEKVEQGMSTVQAIRTLPKGLFSSDGNMKATKPTVDNHGGLVPEQDSFDDDDESEDAIKSAERNEQPEDLRPAMEVANPIKNSRR